ncbi:MAG TPA: hypothetical protein H9834_02400 [Candidatus Barnesiella excrementavium]|nr:hypothetical protein [Candidatus Barnesiella excrementavium]
MITNIPVSFTILYFTGDCNRQFELSFCYKTRRDKPDCKYFIRQNDILLPQMITFVETKGGAGGERHRPSGKFGHPIGSTL